MARVISVFIRESGDHKTVLKCIEDVLCLRLEKTNCHDGPALHRGYALGLMFDFCVEHELEDDMGIPFTLYTYALDILCSAPLKANPYMESLFTSVALSLGWQLSAKTSGECLVVDDLQCVMARFVSGKEVAAQHVKDESAEEEPS